MKFLAFVVSVCIIILELYIIKKFNNKKINFIVPIITLVIAVILIVISKGTTDIINSNSFMFGIGLFISSFVTMMLSFVRFHSK